MLIIFGGLPGTGKSTLARRLAEQLGAIYLRIAQSNEPSLPAMRPLRSATKAIE
jgi:predicted kinase